jgi:hypothetical protein
MGVTKPPKITYPFFPRYPFGGCCCSFKKSPKPDQLWQTFIWIPNFFNEYVFVNLNVHCPHSGQTNVPIEQN